MNLPDNLIQKAKELGKIDDLEEILKLLKNHDHFFIKKSTIPSGNETKVRHTKLFGHNTLRYIQLQLFRSKSLIEGGLYSLANNCSLTSILSARAHFETTGCMAFLYKKISSYYSGNIDFDNLHENFKKLFLGATTLKNSNVPKPIQVMNLIDATDWYIDKIIIKAKTPEGKKFRDFYNDLSEFCHPNYHGITSGSEYLKEERVITYNNTCKINDLEFGFFFHISMSISLFLFLYEEIFFILKSKNILPNIE